MPAKVVVENPGTHQFKLDNRDGQDKALVAEICEHLLNKAGYTKDAMWTLRIEKTLHISAESRLVRVNSCTHFGVRLRIKATPNATVDHMFTLIRPDGSSYNYENLFSQLKGVEKSISRQWYKQEKEKKQSPPPVPAPEIIEIHSEELELAPAAFGLNGVASGSDGAELLPATFEPVIPASADICADAHEDRPSFKPLAGTVADPKRLQYILRRVHTLSLTRIWRNQEHYRTALIEECGFDKEDHLPRHIWLVVGQIAQKGYMTHTLENDRCQVVGYVLTDLGKRVAGGDFDAMKEAKIIDMKNRRKKTEEHPAPNGNGHVHANGVNGNGHDHPFAPHNRISEIIAAAKPDYAGTLIDFAEKAQDLADAGKRLREIRATKATMGNQRQQIEQEYARRLQELTEQEKGLEAEEKMLCEKMIAGQESYALLTRLAKVQAGAPVLIPEPVG